MNLLPVQSLSAEKESLGEWTTPLTLFYGQRPDYRVLFEFGAIGYFNRPTDGPRQRRTFESHSFVGIALGRSDFCNGVVFYNPDQHSFSVSSDYTLDVDRGVSDAFPSLVYDGGLQLSLLDRTEAKVLHPPGSSVYWSSPGSTDQHSGVVLQVPTSQTPSYSLQTPDNTTVEVDPDMVWGVLPLKGDGPLHSTETADADHVSDITADHPLRPSWIRADEAVTLYSDPWVPSRPIAARF